MKKNYLITFSAIFLVGFAFGIFLHQKQKNSNQDALLTQTDNVVLSFYSNYLAHDYGTTTPWQPRTLVGSDGYYEIDPLFFQQYKKADIFTEKFIGYVSTLVDSCNSGLRQVPVSGNVDFPEQEVNDGACAWTGGDPFTSGAWEDLDSVKKVQSVTKGDKAVVIVKISWSKSSSEDRYARVELNKEFGSWRIDRITISSKDIPSLSSDANDANLVPGDGRILKKIIK